MGFWVSGRPRMADGMVASGPHGGVPKWTKGADCKSAIHGFESHRRLFLFANLGTLRTPRNRCALAFQGGVPPFSGTRRRAKRRQARVSCGVYLRGTG